MKRKGGADEEQDEKNPNECPTAFGIDLAKK